MKLFRTLVVGCAALGFLAACAEYPQTEALLAAGSGGLPRQAEVPNVRFVSHVDQQGAPAALAMALNWSGSRSEAAALAPRLAGDGLQSEIIGEARQHGRNAYPVSDLRGVLQEVAAGHPVLVRQEPSGRPTPVYRYALVVGYDLDAKMLHVHSGRLEHVKLPIQVFEGNWQRAANWGVVVMAPNLAPASGTALAAYRGATGTTAVAQAAPAAQPAAKVAAAPKPAPAPQLAAKPAPQEKKIAAKPAAPAAKVAAKKPSAGNQLATVPAEKPAAAAPAPVPATEAAKGRQASMDPGLARLLSVVPVAYHR